MHRHGANPASRHRCVWGFPKAALRSGARMIASAALARWHEAVDAGEDSSQRRRQGTWQQEAATETGAWRSSPAAWAGSARRSPTKMADAGYKVVVTYSPGNTKHGEWVAGDEGQRLRHPRRAVRRRRHRLVRPRGRRGAGQGRRGRHPGQQRRHHARHDLQEDGQGQLGCGDAAPTSTACST